MHSALRPALVLLALVAALSLPCRAAPDDDPSVDPGGETATRPRARVRAVESGGTDEEGGDSVRLPAFDDAAWQREFESLAKRADAAGHVRLAEHVRSWDPPALADRQVVLVIPGSIVEPDWLDDSQASLWKAFLNLRRRRAEATFERAVEAAAAHDRPKTREEQNADLAAGPRPLARRGCEAIALLHRTLRDDPDHARARAVGGWVKRGEAWVSAGVARRLDHGEEFDPAFGWLPRGRLERYRAGERYESGRWVDAASDDAAPRSLKRAWRVESDHWRIRSTARPAAAAALATELEQAFLIWRQAFGAFAWDPAELEKRFRGRARTPLREPFAAVLLASRAEYVEEVTRFEPAAGPSDAIYWMPTHTAWFGPPPGAPVETGASGIETRTIRHESAHQLFAEVRQASPLAGERVGLWAIEAAACYMESAVPTSFGWTIGGPDAGRVPAARERLMEDGFYVPLEELAGRGRRDFQADQRIAPIYSQISGLADFFMNGLGARYREAFLEYLDRVYKGTADADTLADLCGTSYGTLDDEYRRHVTGERGDGDR